MNCAFCEVPAVGERKIAENDFAWAFPTNMPITPGHVLIVPKRCVATANELTKEELNAIFNLSKMVKHALQKVFNAKGFNHAWNESGIAGQSVPHFHLHIVPRTDNDSGVLEYEPRRFLYRPGSRERSPEGELLEVANKIRAAL